MSTPLEPRPEDVVQAALTESLAEFSARIGGTP